MEVDKYRGDTVELKYTFKDQNAALMDIDSAIIQVIDPQGNKTVYGLGDMDRIEKGIYTFEWNVPTAATKGAWTIMCQGAADADKESAAATVNVLG